MKGSLDFTVLYEKWEETRHYCRASQKTCLCPLLLSRSMARQGKQGRSLPWMQNTVHHPVYFCKPDGAFFMENCILFLHG